jgi:hypothetical protein
MKKSNKVAETIVFYSFLGIILIVIILWWIDFLKYNPEIIH